MLKQGLERAGVPHQAKAATACIHVAGRHTQITELLRSGASLVEARELARHSDIRMTMRYTHIGLDDQARAVAAIPAPRTPQAKVSDAPQLQECLRSEPCGKPCHLPSSAGNTVTMELATVNDENPCGDRGLDAVCPPVALDGTDGEKWRRRESNPRVHSRNSLIAQRLWNMLQDVGVSWEWKDDANRQPMALGHEELAEVITAWPQLSADLRQAILAIVRSATSMIEASLARHE